MEQKKLEKNEMSYRELLPKSSLHPMKVMHILRDWKIIVNDMLVSPLETLIFILKAFQSKHDWSATCTQGITENESERTDSV